MLKTRLKLQSTMSPSKMYTKLRKKIRVLKYYYNLV